MSGSIPVSSRNPKTTASDATVFLFLSSIFCLIIIRQNSNMEKIVPFIAKPAKIRLEVELVLSHAVVKLTPGMRTGRKNSKNAITRPSVESAKSKAPKPNPSSSDRVKSLDIVCSG